MWKIYAGGTAVLVILLAAFLFFTSADEEFLYINLTIHGVSVGGMTIEEANAALQERFAPELAGLGVVFLLEEERVGAYSFAEFGARFDFTDSIDAAWEYSTSGGVGRRAARLLGRTYDVTVLPTFRYDTVRIEEVINGIAELTRREPVNARFSQQRGEIMIVPEVTGRELDSTAAITATTQLITELTGGEVVLTTRTMPPRFTRANLDFTVSVLGSYRTNVAGGGGDSRGRNIARAAGRIHNQVLLPGEIFSAGTVIAAHLPDSGYEAALVLVRGEPVQDIGGGVCQVATTLYNAVLRAELTVIQRHNHSARVSYTDFGFDATLAGTWYDLKFKNSTNQPILITADARNAQLNVEIYGFEARPAGRTIRFTSQRTATTQPDPCKEVPDPTLPAGERVRVLEPVQGYTYEVFKHIYVNGKSTERVRINTSTYRALPGVVHIGE